MRPSNTASPSPPHPLTLPHLLRRLGLIALPLLVWYLGSFFFHGDLGKWLDDYAAHVRDPVAGSFEWGKLCRYQWWFFWRPIHVHLVFALQTLLWNHDWANHLFSALMHALACFGLWKFLRECDLRPAACACAALLMLGAPQGFEAIFWPATISTSIATAAFFWAARITVRHAQHRHRGPAVAALGMLGFVIPCLYEQPAAALAALPILYLAASGSPQRKEGDPETRTSPPPHLRRMVLALTPCAAGVILYAALYLITVRHDAVSREGQFADPAQLWTRATYLVSSLGGMLNPFSGLGEGWLEGWRCIAASRLGRSGWGILAVVAAVAWVFAWLRSTALPQRQRTPRWALALFAVAAIVLSLVPVIAVAGAGISPRLTYFPLACAMVIIGVIFDAAIGLARRSAPSVRAVLSLGSAAAALAGCVILIGLQSHMRQCFQADTAEMRSLTHLVPSPLPGTIFVPLHVEVRPDAPHADRLRGSFQPIWASPWAVNTYIKHAYQRADVDAACIYVYNQSHAFMRLGEPTMITWSHYCWNLPTPRVTIEFPKCDLLHVVPFTIDAHGSVSLVRAVLTTNMDGRDVRFEFPQVVSAAAGGAPTSETTFLTPVEDGDPWLFGWRWAHKPEGPLREVKFLRLPSWGACDRAVRMHPPTPGVRIFDPDTDEMDLDLPPGPARSLIFYSTFDEATIDLSAKGDGVELVWSIAGENKPLGSERLEPAWFLTNHRWRKTIVEVRASARPRTLRLSVNAGPAGNVSYDRVIVTCGEETPLKGR